ncbi:MAG: hypothetical protein HY255_12070 [Betaproteobacteria bacterium]|nr:hypothetical protein [Betaproteobacteria bacterium]
MLRRSVIVALESRMLRGTRPACSSGKDSEEEKTAAVADARATGAAREATLPAFVFLRGGN